MTTDGQKKAREDTLETIMTEHLKLCGLYWASTTLHLLGRLTEDDKASIVEFLAGCYDPATGGFGGNTGYDGNIYPTANAVQLYFLAGRPDLLDRDAIATCCRPPTDVQSSRAASARTGALWRTSGASQTTASSTARCLR